MKKLIAISVVFALVAGAAFAADVGAEVFGNVKLIQGDTNVYNGDKKADAGTGYAETRVRLQGSAENDDGTFGGWTRFQAGSQGGNVSAWGYGWWKPIEQVRFLIGSNGGDGFFSAEGVTRWGFYQVAGDVGIIDAGNAWGGGYTAVYPAPFYSPLTFSDAFYGGFDNGAILTITPMEALEINIGIPYGGAAKDVYPKTNAQVAYTIDGIGKFALTYVGGVGHRDAADSGATEIPYGNDPGDLYWDKDGNAVKGYAADPTQPVEVNDPSKFLLYFNLTAIENLSVDIGLGYTLSYTTEGKAKCSPPIAAGFGVTFTAGEFGVKARTVASFAGSIESAKAPLQLLFDVLPSYAVSENVTALLSAGVGYLGENKDIGVESNLAWHVQPYVTIKSSWWAPNLYAGIRIQTDGAKVYGEKKDATNMSWAVPIGIAYTF